MFVEIAAAWALALGMAGQDHHQQASAIPSSLTAEHHELHESLARLVAAGGSVGAAAEAVEKALKPHFEKEEAYAMPPLGALAALRQGKPVPNARAIMAMSARLKRDYPAMLNEHKAIKVKLSALEQAGKTEGNSDAVEFASMLKMHAMNEEQVLYPAAILVGDHLRLRANRR